MTTILIVEDNAELRKLMAIHVRRAGYEVLEAEDGEQALSLLEHRLVHLIVADLMMPGMDGWEFIETLRGVNITTPVLLATALDSLDDKRKGFRLGADDYMTKPINYDEMLLRIEALLRRCNLAEARVLRVGDCTLYEDNLLFMFGKDAVELRPKEFRLLHKLLSYPRKIFTRRELLDEIWGYDSDSDPRTVDTHIRRLREKLGHIEDFEIRTVRGLGYKAVIK